MNLAKFLLAYSGMIFKSKAYLQLAPNNGKFFYGSFNNPNY